MVMTRRVPLDQRSGGRTGDGQGSPTPWSEREKRRFASCAVWRPQRAPPRRSQIRSAATNGTRRALTTIDRHTTNVA